MGILSNNQIVEGVSFNIDFKKTLLRKPAETETQVKVDGKGNCNFRQCLDGEGGLVEWAMS